MKMALEDSGLSPSDIKQVNAHGTSTPLNDSAEAAAVTDVFGANAVPITSTKGVTGHALGAAGALEAAAVLLSFEKRLIPPTANTSSVPTASIDSFVVNEQSLYSVWVITVSASANTSANFSLSLSGTATAGSDYTPALSISNDGANVWTAINSVTPISMPSGTLLARVPMIRSTAVELGETIILTADVENGNFYKGVATISNASGSIFNDDWRYPASVNNPPPITVTSNIVWEQSTYAIWVILGYTTGGFASGAEGKKVTLSLSGTATRGTDYGIFLQVSQDNGATWTFYQTNNLPQITNGFLLARVALVPDNRVEVGETIILSAGVSGSNIVRGTVVIDDATGVEFTNTWTYIP
jgi:hypothetical protein